MYVCMLHSVCMGKGEGTGHGLALHKHRAGSGVKVQHLRVILGCKHGQRRDGGRGGDMERRQDGR